MKTATYTLSDGKPMEVKIEEYVIVLANGNYVGCDFEHLYGYYEDDRDWTEVYRAKQCRENQCRKFGSHVDEADYVHPMTEVLKHGAFENTQLTEQCVFDDLKFCKWVARCIRDIQYTTPSATNRNCKIKRLNREISL